VPFCHLTFSAPRPALRRYERTKVPAGTLGAAFRERRWSRRLEQWQTAAEIGVSVATYRGWEVNRAAPTVKHLPGAIAFLGYDWRDADESFGNRLRHGRTAAGMSIKELAAVLRVDPSTIQKWETSLHIPSTRYRARLDDWIRL